jgi:hypothetical protein
LTELQAATNQCSTVQVDAAKISLTNFFVQVPKVISELQLPIATYTAGLSEQSADGVVSFLCAFLE